MIAAIVCSNRRTKRETDSGLPPVSNGPAPAAPLVSSATGGSGQATITWVAPTLKSDGSALPSGDILRYWVYEGTTSGQQVIGGSYAQRLSVSAPTVTRTITGLSAGTHYLTVSCESSYDEGEVSFQFAVTVT